MLILARFFPPSLPILLWPIIYPLTAGFGVASWLAGFTLVVLLATLSLLALYMVTPELNLSRASQESIFRWGFQEAGLMGGQT